MKKTNIRKLYYRVTHQYLTLNNIVIVVALFIAASWAWGSVSVMGRNYELQKQVDAKARQQRLLELENQTLIYQQRYYQSSEYKELAVRERLGLVRPGEKVLILPPNSPAATNADALFAKKKRAAETVKPSNEEQWINFMFGDNSRQLQ